jgi:stage IV sporulation protein FB
MLELRLKSTAVRLDFSFFAVAALFLLTDETGFGMLSLYACAAHELSHLAAMKLFGADVSAITFYGAGIRISSENTETLPFFSQMTIYLAGCAVNFLLAAVFFLAGDLRISAINLFIGIFNLLPLGTLDGANIVKLAAIRFFPPENVDNVMKICAVISTIAVAAAAVLFGGRASFSLIATAVYFVFVCSREL